MFLGNKTSELDSNKQQTRSRPTNWTEQLVTSMKSNIRSEVSKLWKFILNGKAETISLTMKYYTTGKMFPDPWVLWSVGFLKTILKRVV